MLRNDDGAGRDRTESDASLANPSFDGDGDCRATDVDPEIIANARSVETRLLELFEGPDNGATSSASAIADSLDFGSADSIEETLPIDAQHAYPCPDTHATIPPNDPSAWPQCPLLLRPAPESRTRIRGVRYSSSREYLPLPGTGYCAGCTLPINDGTEDEGKCLVIDFETDAFIGTAMFRFKDVKPALKSANRDGAAKKENEQYYFRGKKRTFQAVVRGRFTKPEIPMSECVTGQMFRRPAGKLPSKWIIRGAIALMSTLAPQLQVDFAGNQPRFLSPLVSTAQTVISTAAEKVDHVKEASDDQQSDRKKDKLTCYRLYSGSDSSIESPLVEPQPSSEQSLHQDLMRCNGTPLPSPKDHAQARIKARKRAFDKLHARKVKLPCFDTDKLYTFEFFQHLLVFDDFAIDLGRTIGKHKLCGILDGQPLKFMAAHQVPAEGKDADNGREHNIDWLWNFDIWHESLYSYAVSAHSPTKR